jgi:hypothetical protein
LIGKPSKSHYDHQIGRHILDSMASSSSYNGPALATALGPPPSQKLTRANFLFWKTLVHPALRGAQVLNLLDGTDTALATHLEVEDNDGKKKIPNPDYVSWVSRDSTVLGWILNSLSPEILAHTIGVDSTAAVWATITKVCGSSSRSKINQLRGALGSTKKLELTASAFFAKMKGFASELAAAGKPVPEDEMIGYIINGLDGSYNDVAASVNGNNDITLDEVYDQIVAHDMRQDMLSEAGQNAGFTSSANAALRRGQDTGRGRTRSLDRGDRGDHGDRGRKQRDDRRRDDGPVRRDGGQRWEERRPARRDDGLVRRDNGGPERRRDNGGQRRRRHGRAPTPFVDVTCQICTIHGHPASD